jgi:hypothetical protein
MIHNHYLLNHVVEPGREKDLKKFLNPKHKNKYACNSHSEDALTWSCFDYLRQKSRSTQEMAIQRIIEDSFKGKNTYPDLNDGELKIDIGKTYKANKINEQTEVDASIETKKYLIFFEAKLYSAMSLSHKPEKPHDQIARKIRVGLSHAIKDKKEFIFIIIDIAPYYKLNKKALKTTAIKGSTGFHDKWKTAWWFDYYKNGRNNSKRPLKDIVKDIQNFPDSDIELIAKNMGWITWADLFKTVLFASISK